MGNDLFNNYIEKNAPKNVRVIGVPRYMSEEELKNNEIMPEATVGAEYGDDVIEGKLITLAHRAEKYKNNNAACNTDYVPLLQDNSTIIVSQLNLDTVAGIGALIGRKEQDSNFWKDVEFLVLNGEHNLFQLDKTSRDKYIAYKAYQQKNKMPRITEITDVTEQALEYLDILGKIMNGDKQLIEEGKEWDKRAKEEIEECLVFENDNIRVFDSPEGVFCSASYYSEERQKVIPCTSTLNGRFKAITLAMADGGKELSAKEIVQKLWGSEAGGLAGIAGSPKLKEMTKEDLKEISDFVNSEYDKIRGANEVLYFEGDILK